MSKRKKGESLEDILERPWCYYCERDFDDLQVLQTHQREQHFHCESCNRRLNTASGLSVHTAQVHKSTVVSIRNALPGREDPGLEIFGMVGVPEELLQAHRQSIIDGYYKRAAEFRAKTGNPLPGTVKHDPNQKGKRSETKEETLARLAEHRARKKAKKEADAQATTDAAQASPPAHNHVNGGGNEGDGFIALESASADALFPAQQYNQGFPNYTPDQASQPMSAFSPAPFGTPSAGHVFPGYPMHGLPSYPQPQASMSYPSSMPPQMSMPPQVSMPPHSVSMAPQMTMSPPTSMSPPGYPQQQPASITPPNLGLPQRPSVDAPNYTKAEFAKFHPQGNSQHSAHGTVASDTPTVRVPTPTDPDLPTPYESVNTHGENGKWKVARENYVLKKPGDPENRAMRAQDAIKDLLLKKPAGQMVWIKLEGAKDRLMNSFEEIKATAESRGFVFDESTEPTETVLAT